MTYLVLTDDYSSLETATHNRVSYDKTADKVYYDKPEDDTVVE